MLLWNNSCTCGYPFTVNVSGSFGGVSCTCGYPFKMNGSGGFVIDHIREDYPGATEVFLQLMDCPNSLCPLMDLNSHLKYLRVFR